MKELEKINKIIKNSTNRIPTETLLVIDSTTGQSGVNQAMVFNEVTNITGIILTKTDSSSKGGIVLSINSLLDIPVKFIGLGESIDDFDTFDLTTYLTGILGGVENE
jgi:fused signal recognition particle receptor